MLLDRINELPVKKVNGTVIFLHDVAFVHDGSPPQTNLVRVNGSRAVLMTILKAGSASTLAVIDGIKSLLPRVEESLPSSLNLHAVGDQSIFVKAAIFGVLREAVLAAGLVGLMILLFLGSLRSTMIIIISIPLSILFSVVALSALGETINVMTLGGLALAVGMLVDEGTVTLENIFYHLEMGKPIEPDPRRRSADRRSGVRHAAVLDIVFVPIVLLTGVGPLSVPSAGGGRGDRHDGVVSAFAHTRAHHGALSACFGQPAASIRTAASQSGRSKAGLRSCAETYRGTLASALAHRKFVAAAFFVLCAACLASPPCWARISFRGSTPARSACTCAPAGTRIEETERYFAQVENTIRRVIPPAEARQHSRQYRPALSGLNIATSDTTTIGPFDGEVLVSLRPGEHASTWRYIRQLRGRLNREFPNLRFFFQPADIVGQILNFGAARSHRRSGGRPAHQDPPTTPSPPNRSTHPAPSPASWTCTCSRWSTSPSCSQCRPHARRADRSYRSDRRRQQPADALSGSTQIAPNFWINPHNGVDYPIAVMTPQYRIDSASDLANVPITRRDEAPQAI